MKSTKTPVLLLHGGQGNANQSECSVSGFRNDGAGLSEADERFSVQPGELSCEDEEGGVAGVSRSTVAPLPRPNNLARSTRPCRPASLTKHVKSLFPHPAPEAKDALRTPTSQSSTTMT